MQTFAFGDGVVFWSSSFETPKTKACKLLDVQGQLFVKLEKTKRENAC